MPAVVPGASGRFFFNLRTTEALAGWTREPNSESFAIAMWTRALDTSDERGDGARDFAFERAPVVHLFEELGLAERRAVEDFEADAAGRRQVFAGGETEAQPVDVLLAGLRCRVRRWSGGSRPSDR